MKTPRPINLLSRARRKRVQMRRQCFRWGIACSTYGSVVLGVWLAANLYSGDSQAQLASALRERDIVASRSVQEIGGINANLEETTYRLAIRKAALERPQYATLLRLVAEAADPEISLRVMRLSSQTDVRDASPRLGLFLNGAATSQRAVSDFALALQDLGLFESVDLKRTTRETGNAVSVGFEIDCIARDSEVQR